MANDIANNQVYIDVAGLSDVGQVRTINEDAFLISDFRTGTAFDYTAQIVNNLIDSRLLMVVSDGVGGAALGEVASQMTINAINESLGRLSQAIPAYDRLVAAVEQANYLVLTESNARPQNKGMSATVTTALIEQDCAYIAEVGDSRAYLIRNNRITQLTTDQSLVELMVSKGLISREQARTHPRKNVILQAIGTNEALQVPVRQLYLQRNDYLLLCSDGISNNILEQEMLETVKGSANIAMACQHLVDIANARGGKDNITIVIGHLKGEGLPATSTRELNSINLHTLFTYDPEQPPEKSHKRTRLLSNPNICLLEDQGLPLENLFDYPNNSDIVERQNRLDELFNEALSVLMEQQFEISQVAEWVKSQKAYYARLEDIDCKMASARERIEQALMTLQEVVLEFAPTKDQ